jgi:hypothetical protein
MTKSMAAILCVWIGQKMKFDTTPPPLHQGPHIHGIPFIDGQEGKEATEPIRFHIGTSSLSEMESEDRQFFP